MVREVKLRQVGGSIGATLPKDMAERLNLGRATACSRSKPPTASCRRLTIQRWKRPSSQQSRPRSGIATCSASSQSSSAHGG
jgi:hypothetical protein